MISPAKIQVRLTDIDILGHVNNAIYLSYFEMTRIHYFNLLVGPNWDWMENGVVFLLLSGSTPFGALRLAPIRCLEHQ